jgi:hypothetical protein
MAHMEQVNRVRSRSNPIFLIVNLLKIFIKVFCIDVPCLRPSELRLKRYRSDVILKSIFITRKWVETPTV